MSRPSVYELLKRHEFQWVMIAGKILLAPFMLAALAVLGVLRAVVKIFVGIYSFCRVFYIAILILNVINVIVCYHDFKQIILFVLAIGASTAILFAGATILVLLEKAMKGMILVWMCM